MKRIREALTGFVVIVVGVLTALASDAAWAARSDRIREQELLADLLEEFQVNAAILSADIAQNQRAIDAGGRWTRAMLGEVRLPPDSITALFLAAIDGARFDPVTGALRSLVDGGELAVIRNTDLRRALAGWGDRTVEARLTTGSWDEVRANLLPLVLTIEDGGQLGSEERRAVLALASTFGRQVGQQEALVPRIREIAAMVEGELER